MRRHLVLALAVAAMTACGDDDDSNGDDGGNGNGDDTLQTFRCSFPGNLCDDIRANISSSQRAELVAGCQENGGEEADSCPATGRLAGHCRYTGTTVSELTGVALTNATMDEYFYTAGEWTTESAQEYCALPPAGTWVP